jgi:DNA-binding transcriptional ArsR family regulator
MSFLARFSLDATLGALADPTRREILEHLAEGEVRVTDLARRFPWSLNAISKHVRILEAAGLVHRRRVGREHRLTFRPAPLVEAAAWIAGRRNFWNLGLAAAADYLASESAGEPPPPPGQDSQR